MDINSIVQEINIDEVLDKVDVDRLLERIDINKVCDRIDWNRIVDRVDVNELLERIDMNELMDRIDVDRIIERSNLEEIVARASTSVWSELIDLIRTKLAWLDQWGQRFVQLRCFSTTPLLPPRPGRPQDSHTAWPESAWFKSRRFSQSIQFRTCGGMARIAVWICDSFITLGTYALWSGLGRWLARILTNDDSWLLDPALDWLDALLYALYGLFYHATFIGCMGRTISMYFFGLLVVSSNGHAVSLSKAFWYSFFLPINVPLFGWVLTFFRRDGKMWNDLCAGTAMVYAFEVHISPKRYADLAMSINEYYDGIEEDRNNRIDLYGHRNDVKRRIPSSQPPQQHPQLDDENYYDTEQPSSLQPSDHNA
jgi:uncharacterized RDD family membrane protein YckC